MVDLGDWNERLAPLFADERYLKIRRFLIDEYNNYTVYPDMYDLYNCFRYTQFENLRVVLLGQDPYHNEGQAHGLCFSVQEGIPNPPSLENIFKELKSDLGFEKPKHGTLTKWAKEGVLLMNTSLSVRAHQANSHSKCGWAWFTDSVIKLISKQKEHVVFILWGGNARSKKSLIDSSKHLILECAHPSPLSAYNGFFGCKHFSKTNEYLEKHGLPPIDWDLNPHAHNKNNTPFQETIPQKKVSSFSKPEKYTYSSKPKIMDYLSKPKQEIRTGENTVLPPKNPFADQPTNASLTPPKNAPVVNSEKNWPKEGDASRFRRRPK